MFTWLKYWYFHYRINRATRRLFAGSVASDMCDKHPMTDFFADGGRN